MVTDKLPYVLQIPVIQPFFVYLKQQKCNHDRELFVIVVGILSTQLWNIMMLIYQVAQALL